MTINQCEVCHEARAIMNVYAKNPGSPEPVPLTRNSDPFYGPANADISTNVCVECFDTLAASLREDKFVAIRATAYYPRKEAPPA